jgi:hypothetical protein
VVTLVVAIADCETRPRGIVGAECTPVSSDQVSAGPGDPPVRNSNRAPPS